jgi:pimeloyl-[acyl-carrier protein] methyl ester esterase
MSHAVFSELVPVLAADFRLLVPDLPGHGGSEMVSPCNLAGLAKSLAGWLAGLAQGPVALLGWSLGGQVALQLGLDYPQLVKRLLIMSSTPRFCMADDWSAGLPLSEFRAMRLGLKSRFLATMGEFFDLQFRGENLSPERRREILQFAVRPIGLPTQEAALLTLGILGREDQRQDLPLIAHPTLVVHGEIDRINPVAAGEYLAQNLPQAQLKRLQGIGHAPFLSDPALSAKLIREFCL